MSEYQYYEFRAVDRPLSENEMRELRAYSTRARITPTSFINEYHWGNFKGDEDRWMERYFDAFLYLANWGTRILKLRLPRRFLNLETAFEFCAGDSARVKEKDRYVILSFDSETEEGEDWVEEEDWLSSLIPLRADLMRGDHRSLYLGWLLCAQNGELDDEDPEPPVPPGLGQLSASLESLVEFLRVDTDLLQVAVRESQALEDARPKHEEIRMWVARLPDGEKDDLLTRLVAGDDVSIAIELLQRFNKERGTEGRQSAEMTKRRAVGELLRAAEEHAEERRRAAAKKRAEEKARKEREAAIARAKYLDEITGREPKLWEEVASLIATKQPKSYDQAVKLLVDLRDLATRNEKTVEFDVKINGLRAMHARKPTLIERMQRAGL
jgi:FtsZ-interacting cell division protein YlmF